MKLSIIITNMNRARFLSLNLLHLSNQTFPQDEMEVIVVDDGSSDATDETMESARSSGLIKNLKYFRRIKKRTKDGNPAIARNIGTMKSSGEVLIYTDPEVMVLPDWAQKHYLSHFGTLEEVKARKFDDSIPDTGLCEVKEDRYVMGQAILFREHHILNIGEYRGALLGDVKDYDWSDINKSYAGVMEKIDGFRQLALKKVNDEFLIYQFTQCGVSVTRALFDLVRGFEEDFSNPELGLDKWAGEDSFFMYCCNGHGIPLFQTPSIRGVHLYHPVEHYGCVQCESAHIRERANVPPYGNIGRPIGDLVRCGFEKVF